MGNHRQMLTDCLLVLFSAIPGPCKELTVGLGQAVVVYVIVQLPRCSSFYDAAVA